jgi:hypothetical protein
MLSFVVPIGLTALVTGRCLRPTPSPAENLSATSIA